MLPLLVFFLLMIYVTKCHGNTHVRMGLSLKQSPGLRCLQACLSRVLTHLSMFTPRPDSSPTTCGYPHPPIQICPWSCALDLRQPLKMCAELRWASSSPCHLFISYGVLKIMMVLIYVILHTRDLPHLHTIIWEMSTSTKLCHNVLCSRHTTYSPWLAKIWTSVDHRYPWG